MRQTMNERQRAALYRIESGMELLEDDAVVLAGAFRELEKALFQEQEKPKTIVHNHHPVRTKRKNAFPVI